MKTGKLLKGLVLMVELVLPISVVAEDTPDVTVKEYQAAIEKFGVSSAEARAIAERAVATKSEDAGTSSKDDILVKLPPDFLEESAE